MATRDATDALQPARLWSPRRQGRGYWGRRVSAWCAALMAVVCLSLTGGTTSATASVSGPQYTLSVIAGITAFPHTGPAMASSLQRPSGLATDTAGNLYIADYDNNLVEKVTPAGQLTVIGGNGLSGAPVNGPSRSTSIAKPAALAVDAMGDVFVSTKNRVVKIATNGTLTIIAGNGAYGYATPGPATSSPLGGVNALAYSPSGNLYLAQANEVDRVAPDGTLSVTAGNHTAGAPTVGPATSSDLNSPSGLAINQTTHNLYIADTGNYVVEEVAGGHLSIVAGNGTLGGPVAGDATATPLGEPSTLTIDGTGRLYVAAQYDDPSSDNIYNYVLDVASGQLSIQGIESDGMNGLAAAGGGAVYYSDDFNSRVFKMSSLGLVAPYAGNAWQRCNGCSPLTGAATRAALGDPRSVAVDSAGNVYVADASTAAVYKRTPTGTLSVIAGRSVVPWPSAVAVDPHGTVFVADRSKQAIFKIRPGYAPTEVANTGANGITPSGLAVDKADNLYVTDTTAAKLYKIAPTGVITRLAGTGTPASPTAGPALTTTLRSPEGVAVDALGNVYVTSQGDPQTPGDHDAIAKITPTGALTILATLPLNEAGGISGLAMDHSGYLYAADNDTYQVLRISPTGAVRAIAGNGTFDTPKAGTPLASGMNVSGVAVDAIGNVYVSDHNAAVEKLSLPTIHMLTRSTISGTYAVGHRLSVVLGRFSTSAVHVSYRWLANGQAIRGATHSYLVLTTAQRHKMISVRITATKTGFNPYSGIVRGGYVR